jgi:cardiolipin synthase
VSTQIFTAPNQLTLLRLVFIPFIVISIVYGHYRWALSLFVLAGLSDCLDGLLARWLKQQTVLGRYLDPIADKLLLSTLFLVLSFRHKIAWKFTILVFSRDLCIAVTCAVLYVVASYRDFRPSIFGKANTVAQVIGLFFVLLHEITGTAWTYVAKHVLLWAVFGFTLVSGIHYAIVVGQRLKAFQAHASAERMNAH